jgi:formiminotetrahydrofolate cyclodeaminase
MLGMSAGSFPAPPSKTELAQMDEMTASVNGLRGRLNSFIDSDLQALNKILAANKLKTLNAPNKVE